jgi:hypothetical protein
MKKFQKLAVLILLAVTFLSACSEVSHDQKLAENVVAQFHRLYNEQNFEEIYNTAHEEAKRTKSKEGLEFALAQAFEKYGRHLSSELVYTKIQPVKDNERQVEFAYKSRFEKGTRNETFLIVTDDRKAALYGIGELSDEELEKLK